jgi:hypothetical protein
MMRLRQSVSSNVTTISPLGRSSVQLVRHRRRSVVHRNNWRGVLLYVPLTLSPKSAEAVVDLPKGQSLRWE